jgi:hypothetical protein
MNEHDSGERVRAVFQRITAAGLPRPVNVLFGRSGTSLAVTFTIDGVIETVEGTGESDAIAADDVVRQVRQRLRSA